MTKYVQDKHHVFQVTSKNCENLCAKNLDF